MSIQNSLNGWIKVIVGVFVYVLACAITYGALSANVNNNTNRIERTESILKDYVNSSTLITIRLVERLSAIEGKMDMLLKRTNITGKDE